MFVISHGHYRTYLKRQIINRPIPRGVKLGTNESIFDGYMMNLPG